MSLPGYNLNESMDNTNDTEMNFLNGIQNSNLPQSYPQYYQQHYFPPNHEHKHLFSYPPPPPLVIPPFFDREISPPRKRTRTTPEQLAVLENSFNINPSPNHRVREQLAHQLGMPERSIQIWFQNRRAKVKNQAKKNMKLQDSALYVQQQYAASAAAAACQSVAIQQNKDTIDPNMYYYYYYYYLNQQQQSTSSTNAPGTADDKNQVSENAINNTNPVSAVLPSGPPAPSSSFSTPITTWSTQTSITPHNNSAPDLTLSASSSSSSITSDNYRRRHHRSSSASSGERTRAHSVGPYYRRSASQERPANFVTTKNNPVSNTSLNTTPTAIQSHQLIFGPPNDTRLYNSTILEETYHIPPSGAVNYPIQQKYKLSAQGLQIGTWKRVSDVDCQIDLSTRTLMWRISDEKQSFRIDININLVQFIRMQRTEDVYRIEFFLSTPSQVKFFMTLNGDWVQCHDFTQDKQATLENVHILEGFDSLQSEFTEILMQAPDLQSLVIQEDDEQNDAIALYGLYGNNSFATMNSSNQSLSLIEDMNTVHNNSSSTSTTEENMTTNLLLLQGLHIP